jgi:hypothetical protein
MTQIGDVGKLSRTAYSEYTPSSTLTKLTINDLNEMWEKVKDLDSSTLQIEYFDGWVINWKFPFIHRYRGLI